MTQYFLFAGEISGDLHGSRLMLALQDLNHSSQFCGVGGPLMRKAGLDIWYPMENFQVMGFSDVLKALPSLMNHFYSLVDKIMKEKPDCLILIDYPGFNLRLAKAVRKRGYTGKIVQYICPTIWAHGRKRKKTLVDTLDLLLTIFPFEKKLFKDTPLAVEYIGNPIVERIESHAYQKEWKSKNAVPQKGELIALFPGSRVGEIKLHMPILINAARSIKEKCPSSLFAVSCAHEDLSHLLREQIEGSSLKLGQDIFIVPSSYSYELMQDCKTAMTKSGTVTLELAIHEKPALVVYKLSWINYFFANYFLQLNMPHYSMTNILAQKEIYPEYIGKVIDEGSLVQTFLQLHTNQSLRETIQNECRILKQQLGKHPTSIKAASYIGELI